MNYRKELRRRYRKGEKGIAILFALGILSVLVVTVMIFAQRAATDRKVAAALSMDSTAKMLAKSAISRATIHMQKQQSFYSEFYSRPNKKDFVRDPGYDSRGDFDWLWKLDGYDFPFAVSLGGSTKENVRWQYIKTGKNADDPILGRIAYRAYAVNKMNINAIASHDYCLKVLDASGNPTAECKNHNHKLGVSAAELDYDASNSKNGLDKYNMGLSGITRDNISGMNFTDTADLLEQMKGKLTESNRAQYRKYGIEHFFNVSNAASYHDVDAWFAGGSVGNEADNTKYFQRFNLRRTDWGTIAGKSGSGKGGEAVNIIAKDAAPLYDVDANNSVKGVKEVSDGNKAVKATDSGIPWLKNWNEADVVNAEAGSWSSNEDKKNQIIANLINYCAPESAPVVSDIAPSAWDNTNIPKYTGNKRTWYLNEVKVALNVEPVVTETDVGGGHKEKQEDNSFKEITDWWWLKGTITPELTLNVEAIKMYKNVISGLADNEVTIYGDISFQYEYSKMTGGETGYDRVDIKAISANNEISDKSCDTFTTSYLNGSASAETKLETAEAANPNTVSVGYAAYKFVKAGTADGSSTIKLDPISIGQIATIKEAEVTQQADGSYSSETYSNYFKIKNVKVNLKLKLGDYDYAVLPEFTVEEVAPFTSNLSRSILAPPDEATREALHFEVADARHNLLEGCWEQTSSVAGDPRGTLGKKNSNADSSWGEDGTRDFELAKDPAWLGVEAGKHLSTAYIRHAPMESLWELGAIHRAAPWQTINLKKPSTQPAFADSVVSYNYGTAGGGAYTAGDYRILDQVTLQGETLKGMFGKIDLNSAVGKDVSVFALQSVFRNMKIYSSYDVDDAGTDATEIDASVFANFSAYGDNEKQRRMYNRSDIFGTTAGSGFWKIFTDAPVKTDAMQEQIIGRTLNLFKTGNTYEVATVVAIAQTIKDVGGGKVYLNLNEDGKEKTYYSNLGLWAYNANANVSAIFGSLPSVPAPSNNPDDVTELSNVAIGEYDLGADQITGECVVIAHLVYDKEDSRWKVVQVKYEE